MASTYSRTRWTIPFRIESRRVGYAHHRLHNHRAAWNRRGTVMNADDREFVLSQRARRSPKKNEKRDEEAL